jgi:hypothetical protein
MKDLSESARFFEASSRLQSAATALKRLREGAQVTIDDKESLAWAGRFLQEVDSTTNPDGTGNVTGHLSVQATDVRPAFYAALIHVEPEFRIAGISADDDLRKYLSDTYRFLSGAEVKPKSGLHLAEILLHELSKALLVRLTGNGVPMRAELRESSIV